MNLTHKHCHCNPHCGQLCSVIRCGLSYGGRAGRLTRPRYRTSRDALASQDSSARGSLLQTPFAVYLVVAVTVKQRPVSVPVFVLSPSLRLRSGQALGTHSELPSARPLPGSRWWDICGWADLAACQQDLFAPREGALQDISSQIPRRLAQDPLTLPTFQIACGKRNGWCIANQ